MGALLVALLQPPLEVQPVLRGVHLRTVHLVLGGMQQPVRCASTARSLRFRPAVCGCPLPGGQHAAALLLSCLRTFKQPGRPTQCSRTSRCHRRALGYRPASAVRRSKCVANSVKVPADVEAAAEELQMATHQQWCASCCDLVMLQCGSTK